MKILLSGFEPFAGLTYNPSQLLVKRFEQTQFDALANIELITRVLPTEYHRSAEIVKNIISWEYPDLVFLVGVSEAVQYITFEKVALNFASARIADNAGLTLNEEAIRPTGPLAYQSNFPITEIRSKLADCAIATELSYHAGTYVCNHLFYATLDYVHQNNLSSKCVFIHIPYGYKDDRDRKDHRYAYSPESLFKAFQLLMTASVGISGSPV